MVKNQKVEKNSKDEESSEIFINEKRIEVPIESIETREKKELTEKEIIDRQIRQEIENMDLNDSLKTETQVQADKIRSLKEQEKIKNLLKIAKDKGVIFAVNVAKKMNDPYILDTFHDTLAKEGYYKEFLK